MAQDRLSAAVLILVAFAIRLPTLAFPIVERHPWRQTQTAFTATIYANEGIDLLRPQVPVLGPPFTMLLEFPLYQAVAALLIQAGLQFEVALRGLSLVTFLATATVLWWLLRRHTNERTALIALAVFLFSPFAMLWSRTSMIEYPATLGAVLFMFATLEWQAGRGGRWFLLAAVGGSLAALVKLSTAVFWVAPALLSRRWSALLLCAIPGTVGLVWSVYAYLDRASTSLVDGMTGSSWQEWFLGGDRLDPLMWINALTPSLAIAGMLLVPFALLVIHRAERLVWAWFAIALVAPYLIFFNVFAVHDYYTAAVTPAVAALVAGGLDVLLDRVGNRRRLVAGGVTALAVAFVAASASYWIAAYRPEDPEGVLEGAAIVRAATREGEYVDLQCASWNPAVMFYAQRKGYTMGGDGSYTTIDDPRVCDLWGKAIR